MKKIGELKGKPIIEGNPNEIKNNQIHAKIEEVITLSERKNGSLETISGGNSGNASGDNEVLYYKVIENNDEIIFDGYPTGITYSDLIGDFFQGMLKCAAKYIAVKILNGDRCMEINEAADITGSQDYSIGSLLVLFEDLDISKKLKGFAIYSEKFTFLNISSNILIESPKGDFYVKASSLRDFIAPGKEEFLVEILKKVIIPVSKEEYDTI